MDDSGVNLLFPTFRFYCPSVFVCRAATCWTTLAASLLYRPASRLVLKLVLGFVFFVSAKRTRNGWPDCLLQSITTCIDSRRFFYSSRVTQENGSQGSTCSCTVFSSLDVRWRRKDLGTKAEQSWICVFLFEAPTFFIYLFRTPLISTGVHSLITFLLSLSLLR